MPNNNNAVGDLQIADDSLSPSFQAALNDRLRTVASVLAGIQNAPSTAPVAEVVLTVPGALTALADAASAYALAAARSFTQAAILFKTAPSGASCGLQLYVNGAPWGYQWNISGAASNVALASKPPIPANAVLRLDVVRPAGAAGLTVILR